MKKLFRLIFALTYMPIMFLGFLISCFLNILYDDDVLLLSIEIEFRDWIRWITLQEKDQ